MGRSLKCIPRHEVASMAFALQYIRSWFTAVTTDGGDDRGASLVEYALLLVFIAVVCVVAVGVLGDTTNAGIQSGADSFP